MPDVGQRELKPTKSEDPRHGNEEEEKKGRGWTSAVLKLRFRVGV